MSKRTGGRTGHVILGFLSWRPWAGYDLKQLVDSSVSHFWSESYGQIYPTLRRLVERGWATAREDEEADGRGREPYAITPQGRAELNRWLSTSPTPTPLRNETLLKLFFSGEIGPRAAREHILSFQDKTRSELVEFEAIARRLSEERGDHSHLPYWLLTIRYGIREHEAHLEWCEESLRTLDEIAGSVRAGP